MIDAFYIYRYSIFQNRPSLIHSGISIIYRELIFLNLPWFSKSFELMNYQFLIDHSRIEVKCSTLEKWSIIASTNADFSPFLLEIKSYYLTLPAFPGQSIFLNEPQIIKTSVYCKIKKESNKMSLWDWFTL